MNQFVERVGGILLRASYARQPLKVGSTEQTQIFRAVVRNPEGRAVWECPHKMHSRQQAKFCAVQELLRMKGPR
jgi:hypothetical protein